MVDSTNILLQTLELNRWSAAAFETDKNYMDMMEASVER